MMHFLSFRVYQHFLSTGAVYRYIHQQFVGNEIQCLNYYVIKQTRLPPRSSEVPPPPHLRKWMMGCTLGQIKSFFILLLLHVLWQ